MRGRESEGDRGGERGEKREREERENKSVQQDEDLLVRSRPDPQTRHLSRCSLRVLTRRHQNNIWITSHPYGTEGALLSASVIS